MLRTAAALVALTLTGCLSPGQVEGIRMQREINRAVVASDTCLTPIREQPDYQPVFRRLAVEPSVPPPRPTPAQLADPGYPDRETMRAMVAIHADLVVCRNPLIEGIARIAPDLAETAVDIWLRGDRLMLALMRREVTFGEANRRIGDMQDEYFRRLGDVTAATRSRLASLRGPAMPAEAAEMPPAVRRFAADLAEIHQQMQAAAARPAD